MKNEDGSLKDVVLIESEQEFEELWNEVADRLEKTISILSNPRDFGAIKAKYVPYPTMIPILAALLREKESETIKDKAAADEKIRRWYWSSIFTKNYSSSVESQMARDYVQMKEWFRSDSKIPKVVLQCVNEIEGVDLNVETNPGSSIYKAIFNLLIAQGAKDWETFELPEYSRLEDHHVVPKSWGNKKNIEEIDSILNRVPLSDFTNKIIIKDRLPNAYLAEMFKNNRDKSKLYKVLESHLISKKAVEILLRENFNENDFREFLNERNHTIREKIEKLLNISTNTFTGMIEPDSPYSNKLQMQQILTKCNSYIYWVDKYFSKVGLDILLETVKEYNFSIPQIKILVSDDKVDNMLRKSFKEFKTEIAKFGINVEMRVIGEKDIKYDIHDRWIISEKVCYNIPSTDTIARGQYSEIRETENHPPFEKWWNKSLDILEKWPVIEKIISN
jgi:hypothetical protein